MMRAPLLALAALVIALPARSDGLARHVRNLGSESHTVREVAQRALAEAGPAALSALREAARSDDPEVRRRAGQLLAVLAPAAPDPAPHGRRPIVVRSGCGTASTANPVEDGLRWLARHQGADGSWSGVFARRCQGAGCGGTARLAGGEVGLTSLALLAFLGAGHTHQAGEHKETVKGGLRFLLKAQEPSGRLSTRASGGAHHEHALATLALSEAYSATASPILKPSAELAVRHLQAVRDPRGGGWDHARREGYADPTATPWGVLALRSAGVAELKVPHPLFPPGRPRPTALLAAQVRPPGACAHGSWAPSSEPGLADSRVGATALALLPILRYYRYSRALGGE